MNPKVPRAQDSQHFTWRPHASREFLIRQETKNKNIYFQRINTMRLSLRLFTGSGLAPSVL